MENNFGVALTEQHSLKLRSVAKNYIDMGYNLLNIGADVIALSDYAENLVSQFEEINS